MKTLMKFIALTIYFFIIIKTTITFLNHQEVLYYIITIPILAAGDIGVDLFVRKFYNNGKKA
jgi:hypothetical protein